MAENANRSKMIRYIDLSSYTPYPKNPKIASVFKEIGLADELGSRIKRIAECSKVYSNLPPKFKEDDIFQTIIYLDNELEMPQYDMLSGYKKILYEFVCNNNGVSRKEINEFMSQFYKSLDKNKIDRKVKYLLTYLRKNKLIKNIGSSIGSIWVKY